VYDTVTSFDPVDPDYEPIARPLLKTGGRYVAINGKIGDFAAAIADQFVAKPMRDSLDSYSAWRGECVPFM
jgi:hypothetical protein